MPRLSVSQASPTHITLNGREVLAFAGCNYLGLSHHPAVHAGGPLAGLMPRHAPLFSNTLTVLA